MTTDMCDVTDGCAGLCASGDGGPAGVPEAMIAIDTRACITGMNAAACQILGAGLGDLLGRPVLDAVASPALSTLILGALISAGQCEGRAALRGEPEHSVLARAEPLLDERGNGVGGLLILTIGQS